MTPDEARQAAKEIVHEHFGPYWTRHKSLVGEVTAALLSAYEQGVADGEDQA